MSKVQPAANYWTDYVKMASKGQPAADYWTIDWEKRAVRAITNSDYRAHSAPLFAKLGIMDIFQINSFQISKFMFYYHNQLLPSMFLNLFETSRQVHNYGTRIANNYRPHFCRTNIKQFTILYQGPKIWNSLPGSIINSSSYLNFKKNMLGFLFKKKLS